jgi:hypothetical protein
MNHWNQTDKTLQIFEIPGTHSYDYSEVLLLSTTKKFFFKLCDYLPLISYTLQLCCQHTEFI